MAGDGRLLGKRGLAIGDQLILAKPLGTGVLFAAHMQRCADGRHIGAAIDSMLVSNRLAAELALANGASACTDITGFGLLGHLLEMLGRRATPACNWRGCRCWTAPRAPARDFAAACTRPTPVAREGWS